MHHTSIKIAELINYLDNNILDELKIWLQNDASIKNELQLLFDSIYKNKLNNIISNTENLHKSVYKKQQRTPNEFRKLCHELLQKVESYLAIVSLKNDTAYQQYLLLLEWFLYQQCFLVLSWHMQQTLITMMKIDL